MFISKYLGQQMFFFLYSRCAVLADPFKEDLKTGESWINLLNQMRELILVSYNSHLSQFEDHMRSERERRNEPNWRFSSYFLLQVGFLSFLHVELALDHPNSHIHFQN